ncbi:MAG TPA: hypothetical protein V6D19_24570 [Stenomitos sp.]
MKNKSIAITALFSACLLTSSFVPNAFAHPDPKHSSFKKHVHSESRSPRALTSKQIFFNGYCVDVSINITDGGAVYGKSNQCAADSLPSRSVVAGHISTIEGVPNAIVISGHFGNLLYGPDASNRYRPIVIAIFPDNTFKAYSASYSGYLSGIDLIANGTWSNTRRRSRLPLRPFGSRVVKRVASKSTSLRTFQINAYCKIEARITDGLVVAIPTGFFGRYSCTSSYISGGVVVSGVNGISDGAIVLHHIAAPGVHPMTSGENHLHYLLSNNVWRTYHVSALSLNLTGQGTYWESLAPRP